jgi:Flp pilus assembly protein TadG
MSSLPSLKGFVRRAAADKRGNVATIFAFVLIPLLGLVGAAVDYTRANAARTALQTALDSTALMVSKDINTISSDQIQSRAQQYFNALYTNTSAPISNIQVNYTPNTGNGATIVVSGNGSIQTDFLRVLGSNLNQLQIGASSTTTWGNSRMRVAMVLDNTGSMAQNGKMPAMQSAAKAMIDTLSSYNAADGDVYVSIVPFAKDVNVGTSDGTSNVNASWLNWTDWEAEPRVLTDNNYPIKVTYNSKTYTWADIGPGAPCPFDTSGGQRPTNNSSIGKYSFACMDRPATLSGAKDLSNLSTNKYLIPASGTYSGMICPGMDGGSHYPGKTSVYYNGCYTSVVDTANNVVTTGSNASCASNAPNCSCTGQNSSKVCTQTKYKHYWRTHPTDPTIAANAAPAHSTWTGCVTDRDQNYDTTNTAAVTDTGTPSTRFYAEQWSDCLPATVGGMSNNWSDLKNQITNMSPSGNTNQAVGAAWGWQTLNTANGPFQAPAKDANYVYQDYLVILSDGMNTQNRWSTTQSAIDARQEILCQNIKNAKITVFTIQVNINSADPSSQVLSDCASGTNNFQMITASSQTASAFQNVLSQIAKLRISQ